MWLREDGTPYYVGKGTGYRGFTSARHSVHRPPSRDRIIVQEYDTESDAFEAEKFFIEMFGRIDIGTGCLQNHAEGGMGGSASQNGQYVRTEKHIQQLRERQRGNKMAVGHGRPKGAHSSEEIAKRSIGIQAAWDRRRNVTSRGLS